MADMSVTETLTLSDFLLARVAEDEDEASAVLRALPCNNQRPPEHDGAFGPRRILAECEAKRRISERHQSSEVTRGVGQERDGKWTPYCEYDKESWPCPDILDLALPYADHPDYRDEWRP